MVACANVSPRDDDVAPDGQIICLLTGGQILPGDNCIRQRSQINSPSHGRCVIRDVATTSAGVGRVWIARHRQNVCARAGARVDHAQLLQRSKRVVIQRSSVVLVNNFPSGFKAKPIENVINVLDHLWASARMIDILNTHQKRTAKLFGTSSGPKR